MALNSNVICFWALIFSWLLLSFDNSSKISSKQQKIPCGPDGFAKHYTSKPPSCQYFMNMEYGFLSKIIWIIFLFQKFLQTFFSSEIHTYSTRSPTMKLFFHAKHNTKCFLILLQLDKIFLNQCFMKNILWHYQVKILSRSY